MSVVIIVVAAPIGILIGSPEEIARFRLLLRCCLCLLCWHYHVTIDAQQTRDIVGLRLLLLLLQEFWKQWRRLSLQALLFNLLLLSFKQGNLLGGMLNESIVLLLVA